MWCNIVYGGGVITFFTHPGFVLTATIFFCWCKMHAHVGSFEMLPRFCENTHISCRIKSHCTYSLNSYIWSLENILKYIERTTQIEYYYLLLFSILRRHRFSIPNTIESNRIGYMSISRISRNTLDMYLLMWYYPFLYSRQQKNVAMRNTLMYVCVLLPGTICMTRAAQTLIWLYFRYKF